MMTCDYKDLTCTRCGGTIPKGDSYTGSFVRPRHTYECATKQATTSPRTSKVYRRITEDDASVYGSQYLGREGEMAWMPRA